VLVGSCIWVVEGTGLTSRTTSVFSFVQDPAAVQTSMGMAGCFSGVLVPTCWPSARLVRESAAMVRYIVCG